MIKILTDQLKAEQQSPFCIKMLTEAKNLVRISRSSMAGHYADWDLQDQVYRGQRSPDSDDVEQEIKGKPGKIVVPHTFAQVMTAVSFLFLQFKQNNNLFELSPTSPSAYGELQDDCETMMARDMRWNSESKLVFQNLLDIFRFGIGVTECSWTKKESKVYAPQESEETEVLGAKVTPKLADDWQTVIKYEGNLVRNVSPYRFFPDTRHPLSEAIEKGEFCASEETYSRGELFAMERNGEVAGIDHIEPFQKDFEDDRGGVSRMGFEVGSKSYEEKWTSGSSTAPVVVTKMQRWITPNKYYVEGDEDSNGTLLGEEDFPVLYHLWYANDNRLIRLEPCRWWHNEFSYTLSQFTPDMHHTLSLGLADLIYKLQDIISWLFNSRIRDIRRNIFGRNVVDPRVIDTKTLDGEGDIYLRKGMSAPIDRAILPLPMNNVTQGHLQDAAATTGIMQTITGVNDNMLGQVNSGRRSAREVGIAAGGAAGRMKMHGQLIWESGFGRLGKLMLSNLRQALTFDSFQGVMGPDDPELDTTKYKTLEQRFKAFKPGAMVVAMSGDFFIFDSTTQSEKSFLANSLQELLGVILQNPNAALLLDVDPKELSDEVQLLRGTGPMKRFSATARQQYQATLQQQATREAQAAAAARQPNGAPAQT